MDQGILRDNKGGRIAEIGPGDRGGEHRGEHDGRKGRNGKIPQNHFEGEKRSGNRRIKGGGNTAGCPTADQGPNAFRGETKNLSERRAQSRPDLDHRAFPAGRAARANGHRRGQRFGKGHSGAHYPAVQRHGFHNLGDAMAFGLNRPLIDDRSNQGSTKGRQHDFPIPRQGREDRERRVAAQGNALDQMEQFVKGNGRHADQQANPAGQGNGQPLSAGLKQVCEVFIPGAQHGSAL